MTVFYLRLFLCFGLGLGTLPKLLADSAPVSVDVKSTTLESGAKANEPTTADEAPPPLTAEQQEKNFVSILESSKAEIRLLKSRIKSLPKASEQKARDSLRTASGNRIVAMTKLKALIAAQPDQKSALRDGVTRAFAELNSSIERSRAYFP